MKRDSSYLSPFVLSYIETALWSSQDEQGTPLDDSKYSDCELAEGTIQRIVTDCERFETEYAKLTSGLDDSVLRSFPPYPRIPHDFWLTRNRHGAGFWDGDYPEPIATQLTDLAHSFGECDLYVGDDNLIHVG